MEEIFAFRGAFVAKNEKFEALYPLLSLYLEAELGGRI